MSLRSSFFAWGSALAFTLAAAAPADASPSAPTVVIGPSASTEYAEAFPVHGIGGDERLIFALQPTDVPGHDRGVWVSHRDSGAHLGAVTPPPGGWGAALAIKIVDYRNIGGSGSEGSFLLLDGFAPKDAGTRPGIVYAYDYRYTAHEGLSTTLTGVHPLPMFTGFDGQGMPTGPIYPISLVQVPDGRVVVIDFILGSIWVSGGTLDDWTLAMIDPRFEVGALASPIVGVGRAPGGGTRPYTFATVALPPFFPFPILPGIHGVAYCNPTDEIAVLRTATPGGIYGIPAGVLLDDSVSPAAKSASVREIAAPQPGVTDLSVGLDYDRFHPQTPWLYWQRSVANAAEGYNTVYRVNILDGAIEKLTESVKYYDWTNEISVLPSHMGPFFTVLTNANMQEENVPESNALLNGVGTLVGPTVIPVAAFSNW
jgi:hypothetical protein